MATKITEQVRNWISGAGLVIILFSGFYAFMVSEYESRAVQSEKLSHAQDQSANNCKRIEVIERKVDSLHAIRAELSGLKTVMSSMDKRLERFESYFLERAK